LMSPRFSTAQPKLSPGCSLTWKILHRDAENTERIKSDSGFSVLRVFFLLFASRYRAGRFPNENASAVRKSEPLTYISLFGNFPPAIFLTPVVKHDDVGTGDNRFPSRMGDGHAGAREHEQISLRQPRIREVRLPGFHAEKTDGHDRRTEDNGFHFV